MKSLAVSIVLALGFSAPALAQQAASPPADRSAAHEAAAILDETLIGEVTTMEERAMMLRRCAGPPPRPIASTPAPKETPMSEPAAVVSSGAPAAAG